MEVAAILYIIFAPEVAERILKGYIPESEVEVRNEGKNFVGVYGSTYNR